MNKPDNLDLAEAKFVKASFASWKLDVIKAMASDAKLMASDVRVALVLLQHLNSSTWMTYPSQETLAQLTHMTKRNVIKCLERLRLAGWLRWNRGNRQKSNEYEFNAEILSEALARLKAAEVDRKKARSERRQRHSDVNHSSPQNAVLTRTTVHLARGTTVHPNTYIELGAPSGSPRKKASK